MSKEGGSPGNSFDYEDQGYDVPDTAQSFQFAATGKKSAPAVSDFDMLVGASPTAPPRDRCIFAAYYAAATLHITLQRLSRTLGTLSSWRGCAPLIVARAPGRR